MKFKTITLGLLILGLSLVISGCWLLEKDPEEVLKGIGPALEKVKSLSYQIDLEASGNLNDFKLENNLLKLAGEIDMHDEEKLISSTQVDFSGLVNESQIETQVEFRNPGDDYLYVKVDKLEYPDSAADFSEAYGVWHRLPSALGESLNLGTNLNTNTNLNKEQEEALKKLIEEAKLFIRPRQLGTETLDGVAVYHYQVGIDKEAFYNFVLEAAATSGQSFSDTQNEDLEEALDSFEQIEGEIWVGKEDNLLYRFSGEVNWQDEVTKQDLKAKYTLNLSEFDKAFDIEKPADYEDLSLLEILSWLSGLELPTSGQTLTSPLSNLNLNMPLTNLPLQTP